MRACIAPSHAQRVATARRFGEQQMQLALDAATSADPELGALQSLIDPEEQLELDGLSDSAWRERIGNAVPPQAAEAIAHVMGTTLLLAWSGETFILSAQPIWVRPIAAGVALAQGGTA